MSAEGDELGVEYEKFIEEDGLEVVREYIDGSEVILKTRLSKKNIPKHSVVKMLDKIYPELSIYEDLLDEFYENFMKMRISEDGKSRKESENILSSLVAGFKMSNSDRSGSTEGIKRLFDANK